MTELTATDVLNTLGLLAVPVLPPVEPYLLPEPELLPVDLPPPAEAPPEALVRSAVYANAAGTMAMVELDDGERWAVPVTDARLDGVAIAPYPHAAPPPPPITARQLRLALLGAGISGAAIDDAISGLPEGARSAAQIEWEYATEFNRGHPLIGQIGAAMGLTTVEIDGLWGRALAL